MCLRRCMELLSAQLVCTTEDQTDALNYNRLLEP
jgi:glucuronate isomerase